jgi:hypothetical protein
MLGTKFAALGVPIFLLLLTSLAVIAAANQSKAFMLSCSQ